MLEDSTTDYLNRWHRVSPVSLVHFFISRGLKLARELIINASPAFVGIVVAVDDRSFWLGISAAFIVSLILLDVIVMYITYRYRIEDEQITIKHGLFTVEELNLKYARIQNINNSLPWYFKPFNLLKCTFDSAGSTDKEAEVPGITQQRAKQIADAINSYQAEHVMQSAEAVDNDSESAAADATEAGILKLSNLEVTKYGLTNGMIFLFSGAFFPVAEKLIERSGIDITEVLTEYASLLPMNQTLAMVLLVITAALIFATFLLSITAIGAFLKFYNFELHDEQQKLKRISGLLERETIYLNKSKVQGVSIKQNILAKILNRVTFVFQQVRQDAGNDVKSSAFIIPMLKPDDWQSQLKLIYPELAETTFNFSAVNRHYLLKQIVYGVLAPVTILVGLLMMLLDWRLVVVGLIALPMTLVAYVRYKKYGYMILRDFIIIREGLVGTNFHILHRFKTQHMVEITSPTQRRLGLASMKIQMAFNKLKLPYVPLDLARQVINENLFMAETSNRHWM